MRIAVERQIPENRALAEAWNNLVDQMERPEVFYTYEWALAVHRSYGSRFAPLLILGYEGEALTGVVSLAIDKEDSSQVVFLAATTADYCDFLSSPETRDAWVHAVLDELQKLELSRLVLANLPAASRTVEAIRNSARGCGYHQYKRPSYFCAEVLLSGAQQRDLLRRNIASKKMLRRNLRAMEKIGQAELSTEKRWENIAPVLNEFTTAHVSRFLETQRISGLVSPERRHFLHELAYLLSEKGWMAFTRLKLGELPIAWNYGFQYGGSWFWYQPTFNSRYADLSPGYCLLGKIVEAACQAPDITRVDLGLGDEEYKERFATSGCETLHISLNHSYGRHLATTIRFRSGQLVKRSPSAEQLIRKLLDGLKALRKRTREQSLNELAQWFGSRAWQWLFGKDEVLFYEADIPKQRPLYSLDGRLEPLDMGLLGAAAIRYFDDEETLDYLLRVAQRLQTRAGEGFALMREGVAVHFAWVTGFEGFYMAELRRKLESPKQDAKLIFDCWTPISMRGRGYYSQTLTLLAAELRKRGNKPWIFGAATNHATLKGIQKAGFEYRFALAQTRLLGISRAVNAVRSAQSVTKKEAQLAEAAVGKI